ncbi:FAD-dependent oxidoreductase [Actinomycetospora endophytica]|uniref:FAD-dependent oxidoreductase n=1 Tax=Actinomycetospora endophytica TaxID=2291215 RepID=A0ABS8P6B6_9PSEU|nr:NAD(P)/FAD-dependent oxidoreductase [Actinomycetospora endophytica]MCD2193776.1 FAD-dependent oxidoreductase [Actinomycetospora endophytica]
MDDTPDVAVVGAGIAGLTAARELRRRGLDVVVLERDDHSGGRIRSEHRPGVLLEHGGIFHTHAYTSMRRLLAEHGLAEAARPTATGFHAGVLRDGVFRHADLGSVTGPLLTRLLGVRDKASLLRVAGPMLLARPADLGDLTSMRRFDTRSAAAGLSAATAGYLTAGPHEFLWGVPSTELSAAVFALQLHVFTGELREVSGGIGRLVAAVAGGTDVRHGTVVSAIRPEPDGVRVEVEGGDALRARSVVLACPADAAAGLWPDAPAPVRAHVRAMDHSRIDYVYLRTRRPVELHAEGRPVGMEVITSPEVGGRTIGGIYGANAWVDDGGMLLVTAARAARAEDLGDDELADRLQADVEKLHPEVVGEVTDRVVMRHQPYTPTFRPGSVRRLAEVRRHLPAGRVDLAGDHMSAPWVEGAIRSGEHAAARVGAALRR